MLCHFRDLPSTNNAELGTPSVDNTPPGHRRMNRWSAKPPRTDPHLCVFGSPKRLLSTHILTPVEIVPGMTVARTIPNRLELTR